MDVKKDFDQRVEAFANAVNVAKISQVDSREVLHDMLVGPNGLVANLFPKQSERKKLNDLPIMADVWKFLDSLEEEDDLPSGKFVVRLPRSLHAALQAEAEHEGVSLNQLVLSKIAVSLQTQLE